jgi:hypothetical protein
MRYFESTTSIAWIYLLEQAFDDEVFEALIDWGEHECLRKKMEISPSNVRKALGNIFYNIRFPAMNNSYYKREVEPKDYLTTEEKDVIIS